VLSPPEDTLSFLKSRKSVGFETKYCLSSVNTEKVENVMVNELVGRNCFL